MRAIRRRKKKRTGRTGKDSGLRFRARCRHADRTKDRLPGGVSGYRETPLPVLALPPRIGEDMLLFAQTTADMIDPALELLKKNRILIALKAIVTPYNVGWTLFELYQELVKEREKIK